ADAAVHETNDLIVCGAIPADKVKAFSDALQKQYTVAAKGLKLDANDLWKGKLTVYAFGERSQYTSFVRQIEQRRPESDESSASDVRSDTPHIAVAVTQGEKIAALESETAAQVATALLTRKAGVAQLPAWFKEAFARAVRMRADPRTGGTDKANIRK